MPRMNETAAVARAAGVQIVHAPSGTMEHYAEHPARLRALEAEPADPAEGLPEVALDPDSLVGQLFAPGGEAAEYDPPLPVDAADHGTTAAENESYKAWTSQHPGIDIDPERDLIADDGRVVYACLQARRVTRMLILGVHTNMCVLHRSFGIKQMTKWGVETALIRDLTDTMYSPARRPTSTTTRARGWWWGTRRSSGAGASTAPTWPGSLTFSGRSCRSRFLGSRSNAGQLGPIASDWSSPRLVDIPILG